MKAFPRKLEKLLLLRYSLILSFVAKQCTAQKKDIARWAGWILWLPEPQSFDPGAIGWFLVPFVDVCSWSQLVMLISYITLYPCHSSLQNQEYERIPHPCFLLLFPNLLVIAPFWWGSPPHVTGITFFHRWKYHVFDILGPSTLNFAWSNPPYADSQVHYIPNY